MKTMNEIHNYWKNPDYKNHPIDYLKNGGSRSKFLHDKIKNICKNTDSILEIGCNVGRNLNYLYENNFKNLVGIEINENAVEIMKENYAEMYNNILIKRGAAEDKLFEIENKSIDLIYTMAVLEHIHAD